MDGLKDTMWLVWLGAALVGGLLEVASLDFVFAMLVGGALAASVAAALGGSFTVQAVTFAVTSSILLVTVRPWVKRWAGRHVPYVPTNVDALRGQQAEVLSEVSERSGTVKLTGETWSARTTQPGVVVPAGSLVEVVSIDGATALVRPVPPQDTPSSAWPL